METSRNGFVTDYAPDSRPHFIVLHGGEQINDLKFLLIPGSVVSGKVYDEDHEPAAGITVLALQLSFLPGGKRQFEDVGSSTTNDLGAFRFSGLKPGAYYLRAGGLIHRPMKEMPLKQSPEHRVQYRDTWFPDLGAVTNESLGLRVNGGNETGDIELQVAVESTYEIRGKIQGTLKTGIRPSEVSYRKDTPFVDMFGPADASIQSGGSFVISGLEPGDYVLTSTSITDGL